MTFYEIRANLSKYFFQGRDDYNKWYVGITNDIDSRVHGDHNVPREVDSFYSAQADSNEIARQIESYFIERGMGGGTGGGDSNSKYVYAYHKTSSTIP